MRGLSHVWAHLYEEGSGHRHLDSVSIEHTPSGAVLQQCPDARSGLELPDPHNPFASKEIQTCPSTSPKRRSVDLLNSIAKHLEEWLCRKLSSIAHADAWPIVYVGAPVREQLPDLCPVPRFRLNTLVVCSLAALGPSSRLGWRRECSFHGAGQGPSSLHRSDEAPVGSTTTLARPWSLRPVNAHGIDQYLRSVWHSRSSIA